MKHWTPKKIKTIREALNKIKELRKEQDALFEELEFQMFLVNRDIDPHNVKELKTKPQVHGRDVIEGVTMNDGSKHKIPPIIIPKFMVTRKYDNPLS